MPRPELEARTEGLFAPIITGTSWSVIQSGFRRQGSGLDRSKRSRDGMVESLRVLKVCRKTAVNARRAALQLIQNTIVCAHDALRDMLRSMSRMQLVRTLAAWRPDLTACCDVETADRISLKSLRYIAREAFTLIVRRHKEINQAGTTA